MFRNGREKQSLITKKNKNMIKKFQSPAGPIEYQQRMGLAFSVNDPNTAGYTEGGKRRAAMRKELYNVTHSTPY